MTAGFDFSDARPLLTVSKGGGGAYSSNDGIFFIFFFNVSEFISIGFHNFTKDDCSQLVCDRGKSTKHAPSPHVHVHHTCTLQLHVLYIPYSLV